MKKAISLLLVVMMLLTLTLAVTVSAAPSPGTKDYYNIEVGSEGKGSASASTDKVEVGSDGTVTFTATEEGGYFTKWIIDGRYDIVSGDEYSPVLVIKPKTDIKATASFSEEKDYLNVYAKAVPEDLGDATANPARIKKGSGGTSTLTAVEENGGVFQYWELECEYEIVSGDLHSKELVIRPATDVYATAYFTKAGEEPTSAKATEQQGGGSSGSSNSPKTGYPVLAIFGLMALAVCAGVVATKKIKG